MSDTDFKNFIKFYKEHTKNPYTFFMNDITLSSDNQLRFSIIIIIHVLHILAENLQSPGTIFYSVSGNQPAKICSKVN